MAIETDFTQESGDIILELINESQTPPTDLTYNDVEVSDFVFDGVKANAEVKAIPGTVKYKGEVQVEYDRVSVADVMASVPRILELRANTYLSDYQDVINYIYKVNWKFDNIDMMDQPIPDSAVGSFVQVTIEPGANNPVYYSTCPYVVKIAGEDQLIDFIKNPDLFGFQWRRAE